MKIYGDSSVEADGLEIILRRVARMVAVVSADICGQEESFDVDIYSVY